MSSEVLAFEGAEGYGATTVGGRGGQIVKVTNLEDSGPGSLRWALENVEGPRTVVFEVNGVISLKSQIVIDDPNVTIAGQTALGDGITIEGSRIRVKADEVIIRGLKFRPGDGEEGMDPGDRDGLFIGTTEARIDNVIVDHNSFTWGVDENLSVNGHVQNITISNNIIAEGLSKSIHPKGEHSKGLLVSNWGSGEADFNSNISIVKNLFANNMQRNPEIRAGQEIEVVNNYTYNYGLAHTALFIGSGSAGGLTTTVHAIGNVFEPGPDTPNYKTPIALSTMATSSGLFLKDNLWTKIGTDADGNQDQLKLAWDHGGKKYLSDAPVFTGSNIEVLDSQDVRDYVLANAGASPHQRDSIDARIINQAADGTGRIVNSVAEAGGPAENKAARHAVDADADGMPNWFEDVYGLDSLVFNAHGDKDGDGFTNVEEYFNGLITGFNLPVDGETIEISLEVGAEEVVVEDVTSEGRLVIKDFDVDEGDKLNLSKLLMNYDPALHKIEDFVEAVTVAGRTVISVDRDGAGSEYTMEYVAELEGVGPVGSLADVIVFNPVLPGRGAPRNAVAADDVVTVDKNGVVVLSNGLLTRNDTQSGNAQLKVGEVFGAVDGTVALDEFGQIVFTPNGNFTGKASFQYKIADAEGDGAVGHVTVDVLRSLIGGATGEVINGGSDRVRVDAGGGDDTVTTGAQDDLIQGGEGNDTAVAGLGDDVVSGGGGRDKLQGGFGNDTLFGDAGEDTVFGEAGDDLLYGGSDADTLQGGDGNDALFGEDGNDMLRAGLGDDVVFGGDGNDTILGEAGADSVDGGAGDDSITGGDGDDLAYGRDGVDIIALGEGNDVGFGDTGNDSMNGGNGDDALWGGDGDDKLDGSVGNDSLFGDAGVDVLNGGDGADWLFGGAGSDRLVGGAGADIFAVELSTDGFDTIVDFQGRGADKIALRADELGLDDLILGKNLFIGAGATAGGYEACVIYDQRSGQLLYDADGIGGEAARVLVQLSNRAMLSESDFCLV
jgi:Ca2+-binding RTX toxin-like protein